MGPIRLRRFPLFLPWAHERYWPRGKSETVRFVAFAFEGLKHSARARANEET